MWQTYNNNVIFAEDRLRLSNRSKLHSVRLALSLQKTTTNQNKKQ